MIPDIRAIVEMLIAHQCTAQQALKWLEAHMDRSEERDYFAAKAMQMHGTALGGIAIHSEEAWDELVARRSYKTADAMLKARDA